MSTDLISIIVLSILGILLIFGIICFIIGNTQGKKNRKILYDKLVELFNRYNKLSIGMSEQEMINIMNFRYDKTSSTEGNIYRFVFLSKGGSSFTSGSIAGHGGPNVNGVFTQNLYGSMYGESESHDESVVIVECKDNVVVKIAPYNMNEIHIPISSAIFRFAKSFGITLKD